MTPAYDADALHLSTARQSAAIDRPGRPPLLGRTLAQHRARLGQTEAEQAAALGLTPKQLACVCLCETVGGDDAPAYYRWMGGRWGFDPAPLAAMLSAG